MFKYTFQQIICFYFSNIFYRNNDASSLNLWFTLNNFKYCLSSFLSKFPRFPEVFQNNEYFDLKIMIDNVWYDFLFDKLSKNNSPRNNIQSYKQIFYFSNTTIICAKFRIEKFNLSWKTLYDRLLKDYIFWINTRKIRLFTMKMFQILCFDWLPNKTKWRFFQHFDIKAFKKQENKIQFYWNTLK